MMLTPRQVAAYLEFNLKLDQMERGHALRIAVLGAQGDSKSIEKEFRKLNG